MSYKNSKYIILNPNSSMFLTKKTNNIVIEDKLNETSKFSFFSVNDTGRTIVELVRGDKTLEQLIRIVCDKFNIDCKENSDWIIEFIEELTKRNVVTIMDHAKEHAQIKVYGNSELIAPLHVTIELTDKCNLKCKHCYLSASNENNTFIDIAKFRELVEDLKANGVLNIELTGGELFLNPDHMEIIGLCLDKFSSIGILTNATIITNEAIELLSKYKEKVFVNVSIDSTNPSLHDSFRGVEGSLKRTCDNTKKMTEAGLNVRVASSIFEDNMWEIDKLAELSVKLGAIAFSYNFIEKFGRGLEFSKHKAVDKNKVTNYHEYIKMILEKYKDIIPIIENEHFIKGSSNCGAGVTSITVGADGNIRPCALTPRYMRLGNIFEESYVNIFKNNIFRLLSEIPPPNKNNGCPEDCENYYHCKGCYLKALEVNIKGRQPCEWMEKNELYEVLRYYKGSEV